MDEPTVGVDPVLRKNIWDHLVDITKLGKKTVIITTHYIEETRQAHVVSQRYDVVGFVDVIHNDSALFPIDCYYSIAFTIVVLIADWPDERWKISGRGVTGKFAHQVSV